MLRLEQLSLSSRSPKHVVGEQIYCSQPDWPSGQFFASFGQAFRPNQSRKHVVQAFEKRQLVPIFVSSFQQGHSPRHVAQLQQGFGADLYLQPNHVALQVQECLQCGPHEQLKELD